MQELHQHGGIPAVMRYLLDKGLLHGDCLTVTGKTMAENLKDIQPINFETQDIFTRLKTFELQQATYRFCMATWQKRKCGKISGGRRRIVLKAPRF